MVKKVKWKIKRTVHKVKLSGKPHTLDCVYIVIDGKKLGHFKANRFKELFGWLPKPNKVLYRDIITEKAWRPTDEKSSKTKSKKRKNKI
jgi:hypothetical protein